MWSSLIKKFGLLAEFIIILLEYACFPVPSEVILPLTGAMSISGQLPLLLVIFISVIAGILGSLICYYIGYFGGGKLFKKLSQKKQFQTSLEKYQKYSNISVCIGRVIPLCRTYISFVAGMSHQQIRPYIVYSAIGIFIWNTILISLGYFFFDHLEEIAFYLDRFKWIVLGIFFMIILIILLKKIFFLKKKSHKN